MAEFTPIETQEQLNEVIKGRLEREQKKHSEATAELQNKYDEQSKEFEALKSANAEHEATIKALKEKYAGVDDTIADLQNKVKAYESDSVKTRICNEVGIPLDMKDRLKGETEDELKADAEAFLKLLPKNKPVQKSTEVIPTETEDKKRALKEMLKNL